MGEQIEGFKSKQTYNTETTKLTRYGWYSASVNSSVLAMSGNYKSYIIIVTTQIKPNKDNSNTYNEEAQICIYLTQLNELQLITVTQDDRLILGVLTAASNQLKPRLGQSSNLS